jgi:hypothetical protein
VGRGARRGYGEHALKVEQDPERSPFHFAVEPRRKIADRPILDQGLVPIRPPETRRNRGILITLAGYSEQVSLSPDQISCAREHNARRATLGVECSATIASAFAAVIHCFAMPPIIMDRRRLGQVQVQARETIRRGAHDRDREEPACRL